MDIRLLLISHASTAAMRAGRFPGDVSFDSLDQRSSAEIDATRAHLSIPGDASALVSPALCARATAQALKLPAIVDANLADVNYGAWQGRRLADLLTEAPQELGAWMHDPDAKPHGGESFSQLVKRVGAWLDSLSDPASQRTLDDKNKLRTIVAVTHAPVMRAAIIVALGAAAQLFPRIEIAPLSIIELRYSRRGWTWWPAVG
nr:Phosphoserine phosphatase 1 [Paraburkholderia busanensis]